MSTGTGAVHMIMSGSMVLLGLLLALFLDPGGEIEPLGWVLVAVGVGGVALRFVLPPGRADEREWR